MGNSTKAFLISLLIPVSLTLKAQVVNYTKSNIYAVVIGIDNYQDKAIPHLKFPESDAKSFYELLRSPYCGAIPEDNIALITGTKATRNFILKRVMDIYSRCGPDDMIIFYFSGHGLTGFNQAGYFLTWDTELDNSWSTAIPMKDIKESIDAFPAKLKISYVDACHAGLFSSDGKGLKKEDNKSIADAYLDKISASANGSVRFLASSVQQESLEDGRLGHGIFTHFLLKGLKGEADRAQPGVKTYGNGFVEVGELFTYLSDSISRYTTYRQRPSVEGNFNDLFPLSAISGSTALQSAMRSAPGTQKLKSIAPPDQPKTVTQEDGKKSKNPNCANAGTGDFCFTNTSTEELQISFNTKEKAFHSVIRPNETQCFYDVPSGPAKYSINNDDPPGTIHAYKYGETQKPKKRFSIESPVYVDECKSQTFVIRN